MVALTRERALLLNRVEPRARIIGVDPDPGVLAIARRKVGGAEVRWQAGMGDELPDLLGTESADTVVSSLVLHQCPLAVKRAVLAAMSATVRPGGKLVIADYGQQRTRLMRPWPSGRSGSQTAKKAPGPTPTGSCRD
ncbi:class I SAM-dependent methyltransferase [Amycolatopsis sp.]|uniref:class I SAM-dependent methyltransferase n=1 Tax=Amycolatopsis sp. TaxID=37632 RepID=UPI002CE05B78|nr:class I SAM-dependent methyltransferase [Amycolatopsis sp.]HVV09514.1 class I SAM-dependent methyltransferase [Amycolatopsis sp.]